MSSQATNTAKKCHAAYRVGAAPRPPDGIARPVVLGGAQERRVALREQLVVHQVDHLRRVEPFSREHECTVAFFRSVHARGHHGLIHRILPRWYPHRTAL